MTNKSPCTKECLKYPICIHREYVKCKSLYSYYIYLVTYQNYNMKTIWGMLKTNLPNLIMFSSI